MDSDCSDYDCTMLNFCWQLQTNQMFISVIKLSTHSLSHCSHHPQDCHLGACPELTFNSAEDMLSKLRMTFLPGVSKPCRSSDNFEEDLWQLSEPSGTLSFPVTILDVNVLPAAGESPASPLKWSLCCPESSGDACLPVHGSRAELKPPASLDRSIAIVSTDHMSLTDYVSLECRAYGKAGGKAHLPMPSHSLDWLSSQCCLFQPSRTHSGRAVQHAGIKRRTDSWLQGVKVLRSAGMHSLSICQALNFIDLWYASQRTHPMILLL